MNITEDPILFTREKNIGLITLNRPHALNALNLVMINALYTTLREWESDNQIHAVVIQAPNSRAFCAGGDVREIYHLGQDKHGYKMDFFAQEYTLNQLIGEFRKPYIALMDGITMGGGAGISLHGSHTVASQQFCFAMPETTIGFYPDVGVSYLLSRCPGFWGLYLGLTGNRIGAGDAKALGLIDHMIDSQHFTDILSELIHADLSKNAHLHVTQILEKYQMSMPHPFIDELQFLVEQCFKFSTIEDILLSLQQQSSEISQITYQLLTEKAPLSLKVTCKQLQKAKTMSLSECLAMDRCLTHHFMHDSNFSEGVRALLIDKDKKPVWVPATLADVSEGCVADYFKKH